MMKVKNSAMHNNMEGPEILKPELKLAQLKRNKPAGPNGILTEMLTVLNNIGIEKNKEIVNEIYNSGEKPEDLSKTISLV